MNKQKLNILESADNLGKSSISPFERQLLHTISHTVVLYETMIYSNNNLVMCRCYISALIHGRLSGLNKY